MVTGFTSAPWPLAVWDPLSRPSWDDRARARTAALGLVDQLIEVKQIAHTTKEPSRLGGLEAQIEDLSTKGMRFARDNNFDEAGLAALGSPLTKLVGRSAISAMSSKQNHCSSPMPRSRDHQRPNLTTEGLALILIHVAHVARLRFGIA